MTTPLSQFPKPEADQYKGRRKLFLVPNFAFSPTVPDEGQSLLEQYWSEVRDHVGNLERSLGTVSHVYHEKVFADGEEGMKLLEALNPKGFSFMQAICQSTARLEAVEDRALEEEVSDWQRCISIGLDSLKVATLAMDGLEEATSKRFEHMGSRIDETLQEDEAGVLFIREDHRIQFPADVQVFYVAPPALDLIKRWIEDQIRAATQSVPRPEQAQEPQQDEEPEQAEGQEQE